MGDPIIVVPYDPNWPREFDALAGVLDRALGDVALRIEHIGSTSVPGLAAKPILDVDVVIDGPDDLPVAVERLSAVGYIHQGERGVPGRDAFRYDVDTVPLDGTGRRWMAHHLYVCVQDSAELRRHVGFRDYLRAHADVAEEYGRLKLALAVDFRDDRTGYNDAKTAFVHEVYRLAGLPF